MKNTSLRRIYVRQKPGGKAYEGLFTWNDSTIPCNLGRSGIFTRKHEGDGITPAGSFRLLYGFYRNDRINTPTSSLPFNQISENDGWCDEPCSPNYNSFVKLPQKYSHEKLTRDDRLYDVCIVMDYNIHPRIKGAGSAIFFHQTNLEGGHTEGCVAIDPQHMRKLLPLLSNETVMVIQP